MNNQTEIYVCSATNADGKRVQNKLLAEKSRSIMTKHDAKTKASFIVGLLMSRHRVFILRHHLID